MLFTGAVMENLGHEKCNVGWADMDLVIRVVFVEGSL